jgi:TonB family protein
MPLSSGTHLGPYQIQFRTPQSFSDFVLRFEVRLATPDAAGAVLLRALRSHTPSHPLPVAGFRVALGGKSGGLVGDISGYRNKVRVVSAPSRDPIAAAGSADVWHVCEIHAVGPELTVLVDGVNAGTFTGNDARAGVIGLQGSGGELQFRRVTLTPLAVPSCGSFEEGPDAPIEIGDVAGSASGVTPPRAVRSPAPRYTDDAIRRVSQGVVVVRAVVERDGSVSAACVLESLDPDLDDVAVETARRWSVTPASRAGDPIRTVVTIEMSFKLK